MPRWKIALAIAGLAAVAAALITHGDPPKFCASGGEFDHACWSTQAICEERSGGHCEETGDYACFDYTDNTTAPPGAKKACATSTGRCEDIRSKFAVSAPAYDTMPCSALKTGLW